MTLSQARVQAIREKNIIKHTRNIDKDNGAKGKRFELLVTNKLNCKGQKVECSPSGKSDIIKVVNGKRITIECKSGASPEIAKGNDNVNGYNYHITELTITEIKELQKTNVICYSYSGNIEDARLFTKDFFIDYVTSYNNEKPHTMLKWISDSKHSQGKKRIGLNLGSRKNNGGRLRHEFMEDIKNYGLELNDKNLYILATM